MTRLARAAAVLVIGAASVAAQATSGTDPMNTLAERYVKLVLAVGQHDSDYVDAFYGPPEWRQQAEARKRPLEAIEADVAALAEDLGKVAPPGPDVADAEMIALRHTYLRRQTAAMQARVAMLRGRKLSFDEESDALYGAVAPIHADTTFAATLAELDRRLPGEGSLVSRYEAYRQQFVIPTSRLDRVFTEAIRACRSRTLQHMPLPAGESFTVEYVTGKSWSGYNWYQGHAKSVIQVNTDLPIYIDRAIDLACHEGYPGHHVYNALLEEHLVRQRGWIEFTVYALFSPQSLIAEGTANYGIEVAFSRADRVAFERDTLFPLAGLTPSRAADYYDILALADKLAYAGNEAARRYLNGQVSAPQAADWLERYALMPRPRAEQRVRFIDQYRSYVINYNLGRDLVARYVEKRGGIGTRPNVRWSEFEKLLASPRLPSDLK